MSKILKISNLFKINKIIFLFICLSLSLSAQAFSVVSALLHKPNDPIGGNPHGKITIVEFFDYQCSHCIEMLPVIHDIVEANKDVRIVYKEFPIRGETSDYAALAALAANKQGKYLEFNRALLSVNQSLNESLILDTAQSVRINVAQLKKDMNSDSIKGQLQSNRDLGTTLRLTGTPAFFIGKTDANNEKELQFFLGSMRQSEIQTAIDKANKS
jgi:protein-disulfide isomerase